MKRVITGFPDGTIQSKHATVERMVCFHNRICLSGLIEKRAIGRTFQIRWSDGKLSVLYHDLSTMIAFNPDIDFYQF